MIFRGAEVKCSRIQRRKTVRPSINFCKVQNRSAIFLKPPTLARSRNNISTALESSPMLLHLNIPSTHHHHVFLFPESLSLSAPFSNRLPYSPTSPFSSGSQT